NLVTTRLVASNGDETQIQLAGQTFTVPSGSLDSNGRHEFVLSVRPETLALSLAPPADPTLLSLRGQVVRHSFLGHLMRYWVRVADQDWVVDQPDPGAAPRPEGDVYVAVNPRRVHVIEANV